MYRGKRVGPGEESFWWYSSINGHSCEGFPFKTTWNIPLLKNKKIRLKTWPEISSENNKILNPIKSLWYIKCHSSIGTRYVKSRSNSISWNSQKQEYYTINYSQETIDFENWIFLESYFNWKKEGSSRNFAWNLGTFKWIRHWAFQMCSRGRRTEILRHLPYVISRK